MVIMDRINQWTNEFVENPDSIEDMEEIIKFGTINEAIWRLAGIISIEENEAAFKNARTPDAFSLIWDIATMRKTYLEAENIHNKYMDIVRCSNIMAIEIYDRFRKKIKKEFGITLEDHEYYCEVKKRAKKA